MSKTLPHSQLYDFFLEHTRRSFWELGLIDQAVISYIADVLTVFARTDRLYRVQAPSGKRLSSLVEILAEQMETQHTTQSPVWREREVRKYVGDYTLFMSGLFRAYVEKIGVLDYYVREGQKSYQSVSALDVSLYQTGFQLFQGLSKNFEYYSGALDYMRKVHFGPSPKENPFGQFLRQVEGWVDTQWSKN